MSECISCGENNWKYTIIKGKDRIQKTCIDCGYQRPLTHAEANAYAIAREGVKDFDDLNTKEQQEEIRKDEKRIEDEEYKDLVLRSEKWNGFEIETLQIIFKCASYLEDVFNEKNPKEPHVDPFILSDIIEEVKFIGDKKIGEEKNRDGVRA